MADADASLVLQTQKGSPAASEALVRQHQPMIHSLTFRITGKLADAEDLAQETFLRAYGQIGTFRGTAKFSTWLYRSLSTPVSIGVRVKRGVASCRRTVPRNFSRSV